MPGEYCPLCRRVANLSETVTLRTIASKDDKIQTIIIGTYYCDFCGFFVYSIDRDNNANAA